MGDYDVVWSRESVYDVADIADYIELRFGRERADRFVGDIDEACEALGRDYELYTGTGIYYRCSARPSSSTVSMRRKGASTSSACSATSETGKRYCARD